MNYQIDKGIQNAIIDLYAADEGAKAFFDWAAQRKNDAAETSVDRMAQVMNVSRHQANQLAKSLCDAGCGEYIVGRKGWKTRVRWHFSLRSLGKAAQGEDVPLEAVDPELEADVSDQVGGSVPEASSQRLTIAEAKRGLANEFGITPDKIEITIRA